MAINLKTVISELQFIYELSIDNKQDPRLKQLLADAKKDLAFAAQSLLGDEPIADNPIINQ